MATQRAGNSLSTGLLQIPGAPRRLTQYLFESVIKPVALYGVELFTFDVHQVVRFQKLQAGFWRRMLKIRGCAPSDFTTELMALDVSQLSGGCVELDSSSGP